MEYNALAEQLLECGLDLHRLQDDCYAVRRVRVKWHVGVKGYCG